MTRLARSAAALLLAIAAAHGAAPAGAQEWRAAGEGRATGASFLQNGRAAGLAFRCGSPGRIRLLVSGDGSRFVNDRPRTLVLSVDGLAETMTVRAEPEDGGAGASRFAREATVGELAPLLDRLAKGREVEVSGPSGAFRLPLKGSGAAIGRLRTACG